MNSQPIPLSDVGGKVDKNIETILVTKEHGLSVGDVAVKVANSTITISPSIKANRCDGK